MNAKLGWRTLVDDLRPSRRASVAPDFPSYTVAETLADRIVHLCGFTGAAVAIAWLWGRVGPEATSKQIGAVLVYSIGLVGMISVSGLYNFVRPGSLKAVLRRLDHSMIFVMIAGSYTPFALNALSPDIGFPLCATVWGLAGVGVALKLARPKGNEIASLVLYLGMGWLVLGVLPWLLVALPPRVLLPLLMGGIVYSLGSLVHVRAKMPFHNAIWHAMVMMAAGLHFAAVAQLFASSG